MWSYNHVNPSYIQHYGILGMKWGIRRFQDKSGRLTAAGKKRYDDDPTNGKPGSSSKAVKTEKEVGDSFIERKLGIKLSDTQKKVLKTGAIIAGTALAVYGGYRLYNSDVGKPLRDQVDAFLNSFANNDAKIKREQIDAKIKREQIDAKIKRERLLEEEDRSTLRNIGKLTEHAKADLATRDYDSKLHFFKKGREYTPEEDLKLINEGMFRYTKGASNNCGLCTTAYELRRRGYDVRANFSEQGRSVKTLSNFFKNADIQDDTALANKSKREWMAAIERRILRQGEGARGNFGGQYEMGGGHSIIYEVANGKVVFRDGQLGRNYKSIEEALGNFVPGKSSYFRMDNLEIDENNIKNAVSTFGLPRVNTNVMEHDPIQAQNWRKAVVEIKKNMKEKYNTDITLQEAREYMQKTYGVKV